MAFPSFMSPFVNSATKFAKDNLNLKFDMPGTMLPQQPGGTSSTTPQFGGIQGSTDTLPKQEEGAQTQGPLPGTTAPVQPQTAQQPVPTPSMFPADAAPEAIGGSEQPEVYDNRMTRAWRNLPGGPEGPNERQADAVPEPEPEVDNDPYGLNQLYQDMLAQHETEWEDIQGLSEDEAARRRRMASSINAEMGGSLGGSYLGGQRQADIASQGSLLQAKLAHGEDKKEWLRALRDDAIRKGQLDLASTLDAELGGTDEGPTMPVESLPLGDWTYNPGTDKAAHGDSGVEISGDLAKALLEDNFEIDSFRNEYSTDFSDKVSSYIQRKVSAGKEPTIEDVRQYAYRGMAADLMKQIMSRGHTEKGMRRNVRSAMNEYVGTDWMKYLPHNIRLYMDQSYESEKKKTVGYDTTSAREKIDEFMREWETL